MELGYHIALMGGDCRLLSQEWKRHLAPDMPEALTEPNSSLVLQTRLGALGFLVRIIKANAHSRGVFDGRHRRTVTPSAPQPQKRVWTALAARDSPRTAAALHPLSRASLPVTVSLAPIGPRACGPPIIRPQPARPLGERVRSW